VDRRCTVSNGFVELWKRNRGCLRWRRTRAREVVDKLEWIEADGQKTVELVVRMKMGSSNTVYAHTHMDCGDEMH
jgi:Mg-chelatase subunit ChlI